MAFKEADFTHLFQKVKEKRKKQEIEDFKNGKVEDDYLKKAYYLVDQAIEKQKEQSINYCKYRDAVNKELEIESSYSSDQEMINKCNIIRKFEDEHIYDILDGKFNEGVPDNYTNKKELDKQKDNIVADNNKSNLSVKTKTNIIIDDD